MELLLVSVAVAVDPAVADLVDRVEQAAAALATDQVTQRAEPQTLVAAVVALAAAPIQATRGALAAQA